MWLMCVHHSYYLCSTTSEGGAFTWLVPLSLFQVLLSWIISWLLSTRGWALTQHLDHRGCFRPPEECEGAAIQRIEDASSWMYFWNSERICKKLVSPGNLSSPHCTHTHPSFRNPAWMTASVSGPVKKKKNLYLDSEERVKQTISDRLQGNTNKKKRKNIQQTAKLFKDCRRRSFLKDGSRSGGATDLLKTDF